MSRPILLEVRYRSRLEKKIADQLDNEGVEFEYETIKVPYIVPERKSKYLPDFPIKRTPILIEAKGWFKAKDRQKLVLLKEQHPEWDIRLVFQNARNKIYKGSPTTYAKWSDDHGFTWADGGVVPAKWIEEIKEVQRRKTRG